MVNEIDIEHFLKLCNMESLMFSIYPFKFDTSVTRLLHS